MATQNTTSIKAAQFANAENILLTEIRQPTIGRPEKLGADFVA